MPDQQRAALQGKALLLDGLDEVRADPGKRDALDRLMGLAGALLPSRLWLACRAADWRHATDHTRLGWAGLPAMTPRVATLQPLSDDEVREILAEQGVTDDTALVEHVRKHALEDLLRNPLTLKLLAEVQQKEKLPAKRGDLFETAIRHLAEEVNPEHRSHSDSRDIETLLDDAGLCCAVLLIAGLSTIDRAALGSDDSGTTLSWSLLAPRMTTRDAPGAVLDTRLFVPEALDRLRPVHRVIAEYVAARWLAKQATRGLTDRRLKALLCGPAPFPRTDLRGLHAWIACLAHTMSCRMVVRDPFGALVDADGSRLTAGAKRALLRALRDVGAEDPFFRRGDWRCEPMAPLADPALADDLRATLQERPVRGQLVSCVLDALVAGDLLPQLAPDLEALVHDPLVDGSTRLHALRALCKGDSDRLLTLYSGLSATPGLDPDFDLRAELIKTLYPDCLGTAAIAAFLTSYARQSRHQLWRFPTWLAEQVPDVALAPLLDSLADLAPGERGASDGIWRGVCAALMRLVERRLPSLSPVHAPDLVRWLAPVARNHPEARRVGGTAIQHLAPHQAWRIAMLVAVLRASGETERHRRHPWFLANCVLP
ncbi:MAG: hypothetical protein IT509_11650, partial [Rhodocyclaceae bacterium]|nr:hypothetical protein [Rhodocyclaceae bacterium]